MCVFVHNMSIILNYDKHTTRRKFLRRHLLHDNAANSFFFFFDTEFYSPYIMNYTQAYNVAHVIACIII